MKKVLQIYNASAGSGKTYTLVKEYLKLVLHPKRSNTYFSSILAMTFTNKAANEMRSRIISALKDLSTPDKRKTEKQLSLLADYASEFKLSPEFLTEKASLVLGKILHRYSFFSVMTLDKFTHKIIRTFARDLNISLDFDVELDVSKLKIDATNLLMDQIGRDKALTKLTLQYATANLKDDKSWDFSTDILDFSEELFKEAAISSIAKLKEISPEKFVTISKELRTYNHTLEKRILRNVQEALDLIESKQLSMDDFKGKSRSTYAYLQRAFGGSFDKKKITPSSTVIKDAANEAFVDTKNPNSKLLEITPLLSQYINQIQELIENELPQYVINKELIKELNNLSLLRHLSEIIEDIKEDQNILLISDFYRRISEVVQNEPVPYIYERLGARYSHFLLDEFQDTSHLQWVNVVPLIHNAIASEKENLIVGDGKQAIYRWRNGEVAQFTNLPEQVYNPKNIASLTEAQYQFQAAGVRKNLAYNFRSAPTIVEFNNNLFKYISDKYEGEVKKIYSDIVQIPKQKFEGYVEVNINSKFERQEELAYIHKTILTVIESGFEFEDIAILVNQNNNGREIAAYLSQFGIGAISPDSLFVEKSDDVKLIIEILKNHLKPNNTNIKLLALKLYASGKENLSAIALIEEYRNDLKQKLLTDIFTDLGHELPKFGDYLNLYELVLAITQSLNFDFTNNNFLNFFLNQIFEYERIKGSNMRGFIEWFENSGRRKSVIAPKGNKAVQIMTIHKSKGLEFPVVISPFNTRNIVSDKNNIWIEKGQDNLPSFYLKSRTNLEKSIYSGEYLEEKEKMILDTVNQLYVAFTRAKNALFISGKNIGVGKEWITPFMNDRYATEAETINGNDIYSIGNLTPSDNEKHQIKTIKPATHNVIFNNPELSVQQTSELELDEAEMRRNFGTDLHLVLSQIQHIDDVQKTITRLLKKGLIRAEYEDKIVGELGLLFKDSHFKDYFTAKKSWREKVILDTDGKQYIPDRVILNENKTIVVDFKTGHPMRGHYKQVRKYISLLQEMGLPNVQGEIYYTQEKQAKAL